MKFIEDISVCWYSRKATLKECLETYIMFLERLKRFDPRFGEWHEKAGCINLAMKNKAILEYDI